MCVGSVAQSCPTLCDPMDCSPPGSSVHRIPQARILEWGATAFLQGIFPTQGSNPGLPPCRWLLYQLSHQGGPFKRFISSVAQSYLTLCDPMNHSTPGLPVYITNCRSLPKLMSIESDAIQPSHPLSSPFLPALNLSQHQGLFK